MAAYNMEFVYTVVDINGDVAVVRVRRNDGDARTLAQLATTNAALEAGLAAMTNGKVIRQGVNVLFNEAQFLVGTTPPVNAEFSTVTDGAKFSFANGNGERTSTTIPAPIEALFGANSNVIDSTQTQAAAWIALIAADSNAPSGAAYNLYKGGIKVGKRARIRRTSLIP